MSLLIFAYLPMVNARPVCTFYYIFYLAQQREATSVTTTGSLLPPRPLRRHRRGRCRLVAARGSSRAHLAVPRAAVGAVSVEMPPTAAAIALRGGNGAVPAAAAR